MFGVSLHQHTAGGTLGFPPLPAKFLPPQFLLMHVYVIHVCRTARVAVLVLDHSHLKSYNVIGQQQGSENSEIPTEST